jgi:polyisoprenoid-binding protein YceI
MKKLSTILLLALSTLAFSQTWKNDKSHSKIGFSVTHLLVSEVQGAFKNFDVTVTASKDDLSDAVFEVTADIESIDTGVEGRDKDLRSDKFFDAAKYPKLTFKSTSFKKVSDTQYTLTGDLTIKDVTQSVTLDVTLKGPTPHPFNKKLMAGIKVTGTIKRTDFGVGTATPVMVVSDEVTIDVNGELVKQ